MLQVQELSTPLADTPSIGRGSPSPKNAKMRLAKVGERRLTKSLFRQTDPVQLIDPNSGHWTGEYKPMGRINYPWRGYDALLNGAATVADQNIQLLLVASDEAVRRAVVGPIPFPGFVSRNVTRARQQIELAKNVIWPQVWQRLVDDAGWFDVGDPIFGTLGALPNEVVEAVEALPADERATFDEACADIKIEIRRRHRSQLRLIDNHKTLWAQVLAQDVLYLG